ncbi:hypothetical protein T190_15290 [Sinorhizobium meliloti CCBAU 01290]|nr:hypothetical protein T190_15290 [Sinorhizobium meliloti CCBAU 01290]
MGVTGYLFTNDSPPKNSSFRIFRAEWQISHKTKPADEGIRRQIF